MVVNPFNKLLRSRFKLSEALSSILSITMLVSVISMIIVLFVPILTKQGKNLSLLNTVEFRNKFKSTIEGIINYLESKNVSIIDFFTDLNFISEIDFGFVTKLFNSIISQIGSLSIGIMSVLFITFFFLKDGNDIFRTLIRQFPSKQRK